MPKHIVKIIWIWIIGVSLIGAIGATLILNYQIVNDPCYRGNSSTFSSFLVPKRVHAQIPMVPADSNPCWDLVIEPTVNSITSWMIVTLEFFFIGLALGSILNLILEIVYFVYCKAKHRTQRINWWNILVSFIFITLIVFMFIILIGYIG